MMATTYSNEFPPPPPPPPKDHDRNDRIPVGVINTPPVIPSLDLDIPLSPVSPSTQPSPVDKAKKYSPLTDLIESEKAYVELLAGVIRKVAAAWSRSNLPPRELDLMFRSVEGVFKTNRALLAQLEEIGENPSSPKALGDLLMRWVGNTVLQRALLISFEIDELEQPYVTYADRYCIGFDEWEPVKSNAKLPTVLQIFSASNPPPSNMPEPTYLIVPSLWTLDALFLLPKGRLHYYKKLYSRLLRSMTPGRSDHRLLTGALEKLDDLLATLDERSNASVVPSEPPRIPPLPHVNLKPSLSSPIPADPSIGEPFESDTLLSGRFGADSASAATSIRGSLSSRDERLSQETALTSASRESSQILSSPVFDLQRRLATESTLDLFTMRPKQIRLQIASAPLPYTRELRLSAKVVVRFTPKATGMEVIHNHGHVFILSDLVLLCEEMSRKEIVARGDDGQDMRLCYPPLAGKVLSVSEVPGQDNALQISIMHKETMILEADSQLKRDRIVVEFQDCASFSKTFSRAAQEPVPPVPPIVDVPQLSGARSRISARERPERATNPRLLPQSQSDSSQFEEPDLADKAMPVSPYKPNDGLPVASPLPSRVEQQDVTLSRIETIHDSQSDMISSPLDSLVSFGNVQQVPTLHNPGSVYPPRRSSGGHATNTPPSSFVPGQVFVPPRSTSIQPRSPPHTSLTSDLPRGLGGTYSPPNIQSLPPQNSAPRHHTSMHSLRQQPLQHQSSLHSTRHGPNHPNVTSVSHIPPGPHSSIRQPFPPHPSSPPVTAHAVEPSPHRLQKSSSTRSLHTQYQYSQAPLPPVPPLPDGLPIPQRSFNHPNDPMTSLNTSINRPLLPSMQMGSRANSIMEPSILDPSPPTSPAEERNKPLGPVRSVVTAQMKCKVFQQQQHAQWKSLGSANLTLYRQEPTNVKQLVVEASGKEKSILISAIVLTDGVERVGKTGVAIELSDARGSRTGVVYMIQLRNEDTADGLYKALLAGSDRASK